MSFYFVKFYFYFFIIVFRLKCYFCKNYSLKIMKKITSLLFVLFAFVSCTQDVSFSNPTMQGLKDNVLWKVKDPSATIATNKSLSIVGLTYDETLTLKTSSPEVGTYVLGKNSTDQVTYLYSYEGVVLNYATGKDLGDGVITISEYDKVNKTISGTFRFNAALLTQNPTASTVLNFQNGVFYKVPIK